MDFKEILDKGIIDFESGRYSSAVENLTEALNIDKNSALGYFFRGAAYHAMGEYDEAILDYTKTISLDNKFTDAYYNRAKIILSRKDIQNPDVEKAIRDLKLALELDGKFADALYAIAAAYKKLGDYHKTLEYLERLLQISPDHVFGKALKKLILQKYII